MKLWEKLKQQHTENRLAKKKAEGAAQMEKRVGSAVPQYIICGLGNPGAEYEKTRHNAGFIALDYIAQKNGVKVTKLKAKALTGVGVLEGVPVLLMKPQTYMNLSGDAVREAAQFYKIPVEKILVLSDDISFDVGVMRIRLKGSDGGQKGLRSIIAQMGSDEFPRIKIGVGKRPAEYDTADWVLGKFSESDMKTISELLPKINEAVAEIVKGNAQSAMQKFN